MAHPTYPSAPRACAGRIARWPCTVVAVAALFGCGGALAGHHRRPGGHEEGIRTSGWSSSTNPMAGSVARARCRPTGVPHRGPLHATRTSARSSVTFDPVISRTEEESERDIPRAADDSGPDDAISKIGFTAADITPPEYRVSRRSSWAPLHASRVQRLHRPQELERHGRRHPREAPACRPRRSPPRTTSTSSSSPVQHAPSSSTVGYGTEVRQAETGPQTPGARTAADRPPLHTEIGQKLTDQILQTNGNEHDPSAGGGTCFGDSGGPIIEGGYVVADTSYGFTNNCRYLGGYQRVDIPIVRNWMPGLHGRPGLPHEGDVGNIMSAPTGGTGCSGLPTHFVVRSGHRRFSLSIPTSTARSVRSSSQSISSSAKARLSG